MLRFAAPIGLLENGVLLTMACTISLIWVFAAGCFTLLMISKEFDQ